MCLTTDKHRSLSKSSFDDWIIAEEEIVRGDHHTPKVGWYQSFRTNLGVISAVMATLATLVHHSQHSSCADVFDFDEPRKEEIHEIAWIAMLLSAIPLLLGHDTFRNFIWNASAAVSTKIQRSRSSRTHMSMSMGQIDSLRRTVSKNSMDAAKRISMAARESSAAGLSQLSEAVKSFPCWNGSCESGGYHLLSLSAKESFVSLDLVARMTLRDFSVLMQQSLADPRSVEAVKTSPLLRQVKAAIDAAVCSSRGLEVVADREKGRTIGGADMDAFAFCAILRLFAEWRTVRLVPEGYRAYAAGMSMGRHDLIQNIAKMEKAGHAWVEWQRRLSSDASVVMVKSPTLRQLLEHELRHDMHPRLPKLNDKTAGLSLLWSLRQLQYQAATFANLLQVSSAFADSSAAGTAAYDEVFANYHGWMIKKVFHHSLQATPPVEKLFNSLNPQRLKELSQASRSRRDRFPLPSLSESTVSSFSSDDDSSPFAWDQLDHSYEMEAREFHNICTLGSHLMEKWDQAGKHIQGGWDNLVRSTADLFKNTEEEEKHRQKKLREQYKRRFRADLSCYKFHPKDHRAGESVEPLSPKKESKLEDDPSFSPIARLPPTCGREAFVGEEMKKEAHDQISEFLNVMRPLLRDLMQLMESFNMNDPSKV